MPIYCYTCVACGSTNMEYRQMRDHSIQEIECVSCGGVAVRDFGAERPHTDMKQYHTPIEMLSVAVQPCYEDELREILGSDTEIRDGIPIARTRKEKLRILKALDMQEGN